MAIPALWLVLIILQRNMDIGGRLITFLVIFIPIVNTAYILALFFSKGADYRNEYGPIPLENPLITAIIFATGIALHFLSFKVNAI